VKNTKTARLLYGLIAIAMLHGCGGAPSGQVVAVVNGEEITLQELNAELAELKAAPIGDKKTVRQQILQQIVDRRLMAQIAKEEGMDRDPMYVIRERRMEEELLVQMYGAKSADTVRIPEGPAIEKYMQDNPGMFSQRTSYIVDQISFNMPSDQSVIKKLEADRSMAEVEATLRELGIDYGKGKNSMDSGTIPTPVLNQILSLPPGEPFIIPAQGKIVVSVITGKQPVAVDTKEAMPMAAQSMRAENLGKMLGKRLQEAKAKAQITYQDGFAPPAKKAAGAAAK
jgi:peptidyl-prolyl cis-trans isomerase C